MNIEKGNNQTVKDYHIISVGYAAIIIATTTVQYEMIIQIEDC